MSASTVFDAISSQSMDAVAIEALGRRPLLYSRLCEQIEATTQTLRQVGVGQNERVAVVLPNGPEMATACLAVASGATCVPLNPEHKRDEFEYFLPVLGVGLLLVQAGVASPARGVARALGIPILELRALLQREAGRFELTAGEDGPARPGRSAPAGRARPADTALVLHTSGTTARPKVVALSHARLMASAANLCASLALTRDDRVLNMMPLSHVGGLVDLLLAPLSVGASSICAGTFAVPDFVRSLEAFDPTVAQGVPTMLQEILASGEGERRAVRASSLRFVRSVSAPLPDGVRAEFERECEIPIVEIYGMTEAAGLIASSPIPPGLRKPGSVGIPVGTEIRILRDSLETADPHPHAQALERGEVVIRGPNVIEDYEGPREANIDAFVAGWLRTGDEGYLDEDGYLFLTGRIKDIINRGGEKISPLEVDEVLDSHPAIAEAATFAIPHGSLGEDVAVAVALEPGAELSELEVIDFLRPRLAYFKVPREIHFVSEIPKSPGGKLQRSQLPQRIQRLRSAASESTAARQPYVPPESLTAKTLAKLWERILQVEPVGLHDGFFDLGGDSLKAATFVNELQREWGEIVYVSALFDAPTLAAFESYLRDSCPELVIKILGGHVTSGKRDAPGAVDASSLARFRASIAPLAGSQRAADEKNPPAVFILSAPRSGSTLLRVMLGGNSRLFAPPELYLLSFDDLADRKAWFMRSQEFLREGNLRSLMQITGQSLDAVERLMVEFEEKKLPTQAYYRMLQEWLGDRTLVDKTPFNAAHLETLRRAEQNFQDAIYIHLVRHPCGMIRSFEEAKLDQLWYPRLVAQDAASRTSSPPPRRDFAEMIWLILQENILDFLKDVPEQRQHRLKFEDLVSDPRGAMDAVCGLLGLDFEPDMLRPHAHERERMTDGIYPVSRMIGDMKFHQHETIDPRVADLWKQQGGQGFLSEESKKLAASLGYDEVADEGNDREEFVI